MATSSLPIRAPQELQGAITHIAYEYVALERARSAFARNNRRFDLEAALVHARNLTEFFWVPSNRRRPHSNGIYAAHYLPLDY